MESIRCLAVLPRYEQWVGNICELYGLNEEIEICHITLKTQMRRFFREEGLCPNEYQKLASELLGIKKGIPLAYGSDRIFLPVRTRIPNIKNDGAHAYIRLNAIVRIRDYSVELCGGRVLDCLQTKKSLEAVIQRARIIKKFLSLQESKTEAERQIINYLLREGKGMSAAEPRKEYGLINSKEMPYD